MTCQASIIWQCAGLFLLSTTNGVEWVQLGTLIIEATDSPLRQVGACGVGKALHKFNQMGLV